MPISFYLYSIDFYTMLSIQFELNNESHIIAAGIFWLRRYLIKDPLLYII